MERPDASASASARERTASGEPAIVLLHGAGTGTWIWDRVIKELARPAVALDVPARRRGVTPASVADDLMSELGRRELRSVILVLHSLSGVLASEFATRLGGRLRGIVYVGAVVPSSGRAFADDQGLIGRYILRLLFRMNPRGLKPSEAMIRRELCNDLSEDDARQVVDRYEAEFPGLYLAPAGPPPALQHHLYVKLLNDRSVSPSRQDRIIARLTGARVTELDAGHLPMLSRSDAVADVINNFADTVVA